MKWFKKLLKHIGSFLLGALEFRSDITTSVDPIEPYDRGREFVHKLTFRIYEP